MNDLGSRVRATRLQRDDDFKHFEGILNETKTIGELISSISAPPWTKAPTPAALRAGNVIFYGDEVTHVHGWMGHAGLEHPPEPPRLRPRTASLRLGQLRYQRELNLAAVLSDLTAVGILEFVDQKASVVSIEVLQEAIPSERGWISLAKLFRAELLTEVGDGVAITAFGKAELRRWRAQLTNLR